MRGGGNGEEDVCQGDQGRVVEVMGRERFVKGTRGGWWWFGCVKERQREAQASLH